MLRGSQGSGGKIDMLSSTGDSLQLLGMKTKRITIVGQKAVEKAKGQPGGGEGEESDASSNLDSPPETETKLKGTSVKGKRGKHQTLKKTLLWTGGLRSD